MGNRSFGRMPGIRGDSGGLGLWDRGRELSHLPEGGIKQIGLPPHFGNVDLIAPASVKFQSFRPDSPALVLGPGFKSVASSRRRVRLVSGFSWLSILNLNRPNPLAHATAPRRDVKTEGLWGGIDLLQEGFNLSGLTRQPSSD